MTDAAITSRRYLRAALVLGTLVSPIFFALLLRPLLAGHAHVCNPPSIAARALVALVFLVAAGLVVADVEPAGIQTLLAGVVLNLVMIAWFLLASRFQITAEIMGWLYQDVLVLLLLGALHYAPSKASGAA